MGVWRNEEGTFIAKNHDHQLNEEEAPRYTPGPYIAFIIFSVI